MINNTSKILNMGPIILNAKQCKVINNSYWDKRTRTHLPLTKVVMLLRMSSSPSSSKLSNRVHSIRINHRTQAYTKQTKNNAPLKRKTLKERTKG
jgi:hypothetical protein